MGQELPGDPILVLARAGWSNPNGAPRPSLQRVEYRVVEGRLERRASTLAAGFRAAGYRIGDRIATLTGNSSDHVVAFFACAKAGLVDRVVGYVAPALLGDGPHALGPAGAGTITAAHRLRLDDVTRTGDDVHTGALRDPPQPGEVAADPPARGLDDRAPAQRG